MKKIKQFSIVSLLLILSFIVSACQGQGDRLEQAEASTDKFRSIYEIFVYSFADSDGDGIGDFQGLTEKLDYINDKDSKSMSDLGFDGIWLMPIMPSPTYHKYDVIDYKAIDPEYGTMEDFDTFIEEAHKRDIHVIIDLVLNHSSDQHPWFLEAVEALENGDLENPYIDYYHFSQEAKGGAWYQAGNSDWYYEGVFWSGMPDINLESEAVRAEFEEIMRYWLVEKKVDGFRLDAVKEFVSGNREKNLEIMTWINDTAKSIKEDAYLVGEAWTAFAEYKTYYQSGMDSFFDFAFADNNGLTVQSIQLADGKRFATNLANAQELLKEQNENAINASFLSNHDTGRLAGFLASDLDKLKLAAASNLFTSGTSFVYYGEEIGMRGAGRDENKRAPMLWSEEDSMQTRGPLEMEEGSYAYPFGSVADQAEDKDSLLQFYKTLVRLRQVYPEIPRGKTTAIEAIMEEEKVIAAFTKTYEDEESTLHELSILMNFSLEEKTITVPEDLAGQTIIHQLNTKGVEIQMEDSKVTLPPASMILLKDE